MDEDKNDKPYNPYFQNDDIDKPAAPVAPPQVEGDTSDAFTTELKDRTHWWEKLGKRQWILIGSVTAALLIIGGAGMYLLSRPQQVSTGSGSGTATKKVVKTDEPIVSALTGMPVSAEDRKRPVTAVMVENSQPARPQAGLWDAGIVYEAIAEAGITRFMALYQESQPANIGPIRSSRLYYLQWAQGYDASYAHVGGSPEALNYIKANPIKDMDQSYNSSYFQRISARQAPHNVYTSIAKLNELEKAKGWFTEPNFTGFSRKKDQPAATPTANAIDIAISSSAFQVHYDYAKASNTYNRVMGGEPHVDSDTNKQLSPKVVVTLVVPYSIQSDGYHSNYNVIGTGPATVFQDGTATQVTWSKSSATDHLALKDAKGNDVKLNAGQTWITAVGSPTAVSSRQ